VSHGFGSQRSAAARRRATSASSSCCEAANEANKAKEANYPRPVTRTGASTPRPGTRSAP
jgi:hypothetical protein